MDLLSTEDSPAMDAFAFIVVCNSRHSQSGAAEIQVLLFPD